MALVSQEPVLFDGTIRYNISYGAENLNDEGLHAAARAANVDSFVSEFADGYDTKVGERGVKLSGGQKQRGIILVLCILLDVFPQLSCAQSGHVPLPSLPVLLVRWHGCRCV